MAFLDLARRQLRSVPSGPRMELSGSVGRQVARVATGPGDTLRLALSRLRPYGQWHHMPERMHAREAGRVYPHILLYVCDYAKEGHKHCGYTEEDLAFILGNAPSLPDPVYRYVAYRVDGNQIATRDTVLTFPLRSSSTP